MDSSGTSQVVILLMFSVLAALAVVLRFWSRRIKNVKIELDDALIIPGAVCLLQRGICNTLLTNVHQILALVCGTLNIHGTDSGS